MSPLEYIEEGILNGNWETVCEGYERLTGKSLRLPVDRLGEVRQAKEALSQIVNIASSILAGQIEEICNTTIESTKKKTCRKRISSKKKTKNKTTINKDGEDSSIILDDANKTIVQKEVGNTQLITNDPDPAEVEANKARAAKVNRNKLKIKRKVPTVYNVECNECSNTFKSTRPKGEMGQKCPKCLSGLKGRFA